MENSQFKFICCSARFPHCSVGSGSMSHITLVHRTKNNPLKTLFLAFFLFLGLAGSDRADQTVRSDRFSLPELKSLLIKPAFYFQNVLYLSDCSVLAQLNNTLKFSLMARRGESRTHRAAGLLPLGPPLASPVHIH